MEKKSGKENGLTLQDCIGMMRGNVAHYRTAGKAIYEIGIYRRGRSHCRPTDKGHPCYEDIYYMNEEGSIETLCYNTSPRRTDVLIKSLIDGTINNVPADIIDNYRHNGYNTRAGLFRSAKNIDRIKQVARSHADYLGSETGSSTADHDNRASMRN